MNMLIRYKRTITLAIINFINSLAEYVSLVILALYINKKVSIIETTVVIAIPSLFSSFFGSVSVKFQNLLGSKRCLIFSFFLNFLAYQIYYLSNAIILLLIAAVINGMSRILFQPVMKTLLCEASDEFVQKENVHRLRYLTICLAGILGPFLGCLISDSFSKEACIQVTLILIAISIFLTYIMIPKEKTEYIKQEKKGNIFDFVRDISNVSNLLWIYILVGTLIFFVFVQFESTYSLYLKSYFEKSEKVFSILLAFNSIFGILFQLILSKVKIKESKYLVSVGICFFISAFLIFSVLFYKNSPTILLLVIAIMIYSIGEVMVIPGLDIIIDEISTPEKKTLYFGLAEIRNLGFTLGPIFCGFVLQYYSPFIASLLSCLVLIFADALFLILPRLYLKKRVYQ